MSADLPDETDAIDDLAHALADYFRRKESPVSLVHGGVVPHIIFQSPRLQLEEFESQPSKRLLQQYLHISDMPRRAYDVR